MQWSDLIDNPYLQNLPFKIELNKWGRIEMSPASNLHGIIQAEIAGELRKRRGGTIVVECSIQTSDGVRVADVAWVSQALLKEFGSATPYPRAPEVCVAIKSPASSWAEMHMRAGLYLEAGAIEIWIVALDRKRTVIKAEPD